MGSWKDCCLWFNCKVYLGSGKVLMSDFLTFCLTILKALLPTLAMNVIIVHQHDKHCRLDMSRQVHQAVRINKFDHAPFENVLLFTQKATCRFLMLQIRSVHVADLLLIFIHNIYIYIYTHSIPFCLILCAQLFL